MVLLIFERNHYIIIRPTHIGQEKKDDFNQLFGFLKKNINIRKDLQIIDNLNCIGNVEEIPIFFEMYNNYTIAKIGEKTVKIKSFGYQKNRESVLLCITGNGGKLHF